MGIVAATGEALAGDWLAAWIDAAHLVRYRLLIPLVRRLRRCTREPPQGAGTTR